MRPFRALAAATSAGFAAVVTLHALTPRPRVGIEQTTTTTTPGSSSTTVPTGTRSAVGASSQFGYGTVSVKVTVNGTRVVAVSIASIQTAESYSQSIANQALPTLTSEALSAQSANIQGVSGASYTTAGFEQSLQSALTQLGL